MGFHVVFLRFAFFDARFMEGWGRFVYDKGGGGESLINLPGAAEL